MLVYVLNFLLITASITLFVLPFYAIFLWRRHERPRLHGINASLEDFFSSPQANWLVFAWAASEAVIWFVIPEFLLLLVLFMRIQKKRQMLYFDLAGTVFGTALAFAMRLPDHAIAQLPYIQERMVSQTRIWYDHEGILALAHQPFSGVPYKVFTHLAWQYEFFFPLFLIAAVVARMFRYVFAYGLFLALYPKLHKIVNRNYLPLAAGAILIFSILLYKTYHHYG